MEDFNRAAEQTRRTIEGMANEAQAPRRLMLLEAILLTQRQKRTELVIPVGDPNEGEFLDVIVLNDDSTIRDYSADMRLVILVAALSHPDVLLYINLDFPPTINPANDSQAEAIAAKIRETTNLVGLWELTWKGSGYWLLQLVCPDGHTKPTHGSLLVR